jgi:hypothetical protein
MCDSCTDDCAAPLVHVRSTASLRIRSQITARPRLRRIASFGQWALPVSTLALMPKCPACLAAYVVFFSGIGLSLPTATAMRWALIALSIASLGYLLLRAACRALPAPA